MLMCSAAALQCFWWLVRQKCVHFHNRYFNAFQIILHIGYYVLLHMLLHIGSNSAAMQNSKSPDLPLMRFVEICAP